MAVETNKGGTPTAPNPGTTLTGVPAAAGTPAAGTTLTGMAAATAAAKGRPRKRSSSLMQIQSSLPSVESSLDEFIARANQTMTDPASWQAEQVKQAEEDEARREADALRWKAAEQQLREGEAREASLRRQLDGLQGRLAEAEARAAVASTGSSQDGVVADLKVRLQRTEEKLRTAEQQAAQAQQMAQHAQQRAEQLTIELATAKSTPAVRDSLPSYDNEELQERVRVAEAKAQKAIAAAKAASAGLTVNPADIAAIESGLVVPSFDKPKGTNWGLVVGALAIGAAAMFGVTKFVLKPDAAPAAAAATEAQPAAAPAAAPAKPIVTPIEDNAAPGTAAAAAAPAAAAPAAAAPAAAAPAATNDADKLAAEKLAAEKAAAEQAIADKKAAAEKAAAEKAMAEQAAADAAAAKKHAAPAPKHAAKAAPAGGIADPFGGSTETPAPKKAAPKKADKKAGGIVDPF